MSRKDELLKLAELFHLQASRTGTPGVKQTLHRMGQYYRNEAAHAPDRDAERRRSLKEFNRHSCVSRYSLTPRRIWWVAVAHVTVSVDPCPIKFHQRRELQPPQQPDRNPFPSNPVDRASDWDVLSSVGGHHGHCTFYRPRHSGVRHNR